MEQLTTLDELHRHTWVLATIEETEAPFVSCYLNLERGEAGSRTFEARTVALRASISSNARVDFDAAMERIAAYLATELRADAQGVALFARSVLGGGFFLPMQFAAPVPNWIAAGPTPNLVHLMALMDTYHRYLVLMATKAWVRILEVNLGAATVKACNRPPDLVDGANRRWTSAYDESRRRERATRFLKEQIDLLERLMTAGRHTHLILAGDPRSTGEIQRALPKSVAAKLVDTIPVSCHHAPEDVVAATLSAFVEWEEQESQAIAARVMQEVRAEGPAAVGAPACLEALRQRRARVLLLARDHLPVPGWRCAACGAMRFKRQAPAACPECGKEAVWPIDATAELVRLAGQRDCPVEVVDHCDPLMAMGGVGCLLRY